MASMSHFPAGSLEWCLALSLSVHFWVYPHFFVITGYLPPDIRNNAFVKQLWKSAVGESIIIQRIWYDSSIDFTLAVKIIYYFGILVLSSKFGTW
jgi:hypothetical protein